MKIKVKNIQETIKILKTNNLLLEDKISDIYSNQILFAIQKIKKRFIDYSKSDELVDIESALRYAENLVFELQNIRKNHKKEKK